MLCKICNGPTETFKRQYCNACRRQRWKERTRRMMDAGRNRSARQGGRRRKPLDLVIEAAKDQRIAEMAELARQRRPLT
jgi:hypothetical protein